MSLYNDQKKVLLAYIDTLQNTPDSLILSSGHGLQLEEALNRCAERHAPDADFLLTLSQQDTLVALTNKYLSLRRKIAPNAVLPDTLHTDSLP